MSEPYTFSVMLEITTTDPRLTADALNRIGYSARDTATIRRAVLQHLPRDVTRVVAAIPLEQALEMLRLWELLLVARGGEPPQRPTPDYVPPTQD